MGRMEKINKQVKHAWIAGTICGAINLILILIGIMTPAVLLDVFIIFGLTFGIYKKSRVCAVLMLIYFIANKILIAVIMPGTMNIFVVILSLVFIFFFSEGVLGTFAYHKMINEQTGRELV